MNLGLKLAVVAGFATVLSFRGGGEGEPLAASSEATAVPTTPPDTSAAPAPRADLQTKAEVRPTAAEDPPSGIEVPGRVPAIPESDGALSVSAPETTRDQAASAFAAEVLRLSSEADEVDRLWLTYKNKCGVQVGRQYGFGREWFSVFDRATEQTINAPGCDDLGRRLRLAGEAVGRAIHKARTTARQAFLDPATENGMLRWHALHWPQFDHEDDKPRGRAEQKASSVPARSADGGAAAQRRETSAGPP